jgi:hypothetical protein
MEARHDDRVAYEDWLESFPAHEKGFIKRMTFQRAQPDGTVFTRTIMAREGHDLPPLAH